MLSLRFVQPWPAYSVRWVSSGKAREVAVSMIPGQGMRLSIHAQSLVGALAGGRQAEFLPLSFSLLSPLSKIKEKKDSYDELGEIQM